MTFMYVIEVTLILYFYSLCSQHAISNKVLVYCKTKISATFFYRLNKTLVFNSLRKRKPGTAIFPTLPRLSESELSCKDAILYPPRF